MPRRDPKLDAVLDRFEDAWQRGETPAVEAFLPDDPGLRQAALPDLVHIDLELRLKAGQPARVEQYLERFPALKARRDLLLKLIRAEWTLRQRNEALGLNEYLRRFPECDMDLMGGPLPGLPNVEKPTAQHPEKAKVIPLPTEFGRYRILRPLGLGGMGAVYLARDTHLERNVALKVPHYPLDPPVVQRFLREARAAAALHHPNLCPVFEAGEITGVPFFTMAFIEGKPLSQALPRPTPPRQAVELTRKLALALAEAHRNGVIHRDLKPGNILITTGGEPVVMDFGLARRVESSETARTLSGTVMGTPGYMAPEQALGDSERIGPPCDVYSLGVVLYELLTGERPFRGSAIELMQQVVSCDPPPLRQHQPNLDSSLEQLCLKALAKLPRDRYPSMTAFCEALTGWLAGPAPAADRPPPPDPRVAGDVLRLLREWGWDAGMKKLRAMMEADADPGKRAALQLLTGWLAGELGRYDEARQLLGAVAEWPRLRGWARAGEAVMAMREKNYSAAQELFARAEAEGGAEDPMLRANLAHLRGTLASHRGQFADALAHLHTALERLGPDHFATGRVLDTLGMVHAGRNSFSAAAAFYRAALKRKESSGDDAGVSLGHGQLGRLYLAWRRLDQADDHFRKGIDRARQTGDERGEAQLYNHRGQVLLERGRPVEALDLLDEAIRSATGRWLVIEGYAHKDRALACLQLDELDQAERECERAGELFQQAGFHEGMAHIRRTGGLLRRRQQRYSESSRWLREAAGLFERVGEPAEQALCLRELAATLKAGGAAGGLVVEALLAALDTAEATRRGWVVAMIREDLEHEAPRELARREYQRLTGGASAPEGVEETASVLCCGPRLHPLPPATPSADLETRNDLYAELETVLAAQEVTVSQYRWDSFLALARGPDHARHAVAAGLALLRTLGELNRPRRVLQWPLWQTPVVVASGVVRVDAVGTFKKTDRVAFGPPAQLAAALLADLEPDRVWVNEATFRLTAGVYSFQAGGPYSVFLKGSGPQSLWEVVDADSSPV